jgi:hypothetical protein
LTWRLRLQIPIAIWIEDPERILQVRRRMTICPTERCLIRRHPHPSTEALTEIASCRTFASGLLDRGTDTHMPRGTGAVRMSARNLLPDRESSISGYRVQTLKQQCFCSAHNESQCSSYAILEGPKWVFCRCSTALKEWRKEKARSMGRRTAFNRRLERCFA